VVFIIFSVYSLPAAVRCGRADECSVVFFPLCPQQLSIPEQTRNQSSFFDQRRIQSGKVVLTLNMELGRLIECVIRGLEK